MVIGGLTGAAAIDEMTLAEMSPFAGLLAISVINALLVQYGTRQMIGGLKYVNIGAGIGLAFMVYRTHKTIWELDMKQKQGVVAEESAVLSR